MRLGRLWVVLLAVLVALGLAGCLQQAPTRPAATATATATTAASARASRSGTDPETHLRWIAVAQLPKEARDTLALIDKGGPFPYPKNDGVVFENREQILPKQPSGYYHEYTVITPGSPDRGPRRIIVGGQKAQFFYTDDHYASFTRIDR